MREETDTSATQLLLESISKSCGIPIRMLTEVKTDADMSYDDRLFFQRVREHHKLQEHIFNELIDYYRIRLVSSVVDPLLEKLGYDTGKYRIVWGSDTEER